MTSRRFGLLSESHNTRHGDASLVDTGQGGPRGLQNNTVIPTARGYLPWRHRKTLYWKQHTLRLQETETPISNWSEDVLPIVNVHSTKRGYSGCRERKYKDLKCGGAHWVGYRGTRRGMVCDYDHISYAYEILESKENFKRMSTWFLGQLIKTEAQLYVLSLQGITFLFLCGCFASLYVCVACVCGVWRAQGRDGISWN